MGLTAAHRCCGSVDAGAGAGGGAGDDADDSRNALAVTGSFREEPCRLATEGNGC